MSIRMDFRCKVTQKSTIMQILFAKTFLLHTLLCKIPLLLPFLCLIFFNQFQQPLDSLFLRDVLHHALLAAV